MLSLVSYAYKYSQRIKGHSHRAPKWWKVCRYIFCTTLHYVVLVPNFHQLRIIKITALLLSGHAKFHHQRKRTCGTADLARLHCSSLLIRTPSVRHFTTPRSRESTFFWIFRCPTDDRTIWSIMSGQPRSHKNFDYIVFLASCHISDRSDLLKKERVI